MIEICYYNDVGREKVRISERVFATRKKPRGGDDPFERLPYQLSMVVAVPTMVTTGDGIKIARDTTHARNISQQDASASQAR